MATAGKILSPEPGVTRTGGERAPHAPVTSFTWAEVVPTNAVPPVPQLPEPWLSAQTIARFPVIGSTLKDG